MPSRGPGGGSAVTPRASCSCAPPDLQLGGVEAYVTSETHVRDTVGACLGQEPRRGHAQHLAGIRSIEQRRGDRALCQPLGQSVEDCIVQALQQLLGAGAHDFDLPFRALLVLSTGVAVVRR